MTVGKRSSDVKIRYELLDIIRAVAVINMIVYHLLWDMVYIYGFNIPWYKGTVGTVWQQLICCTFILLSGFCVNLGKHKLKRGITVFLGGAVVTAVTALFMPDDLIIFGILTFIGSSMLLFCLLENPLGRVDPHKGAVIFLLLFILFRDVEFGRIGIKLLFIVDMPKWLYGGYLSAFFGFPHRSFSSSDYFPLIPWFFLFTVGFYLYHIFKRSGKLRFFALKSKNIFLKTLTFIGKNSFVIYLLHQPVIYFILFFMYKGRI